MTHQISFRTVVFLSAAILAQVAFSAPPRFTAVEWSDGLRAHNTFGQRIGVGVTGLTGPYPGPYLWTPDTPNSTIGTYTSLLDFGYVPDWPEYPMAINVSGSILVQGSSGEFISSFLWQPQSPNSPIGRYTIVVPRSTPRGLNDFGQVLVNESDSILFTPTTRGGSTGSFTHLIPPTAGTRFEAWSLNNAGYVVGTAYHETTYQAAAWVPQDGNSSDGEFVILPSIEWSGPAASSALRMNQLGWIIGSSVYSNVVRRNSHATLWRPSPEDPSVFQLTELGDLFGGNTSSFAGSINDNGWITGISRDGNDPNLTTSLSLPFLWTPEDGMFDLMRLIDTPFEADLVGLNAVLINNQNEMTAIATYDPAGTGYSSQSYQKTYLLAPVVPEPVMAILFAAIALTNRKR